MSEPQDLPGGYKERMSHSTCVIIEEAARAMEIVEEFAGDNVIMEGNGIKVTIERDLKDKETTDGGCDQGDWII